MNKFKSFMSGIIAVVLALILLLALTDYLIKAAIEMTSPRIIGAKVQMGDLSLGLLTHKVHIKDFRLSNPPGFPDEVFLVMPEVTADVDIWQLIQGKMHFPLVVFNMEKMVIIKNKEGKLNVNSLKIIQDQLAANKGKPMKLPVFRIDLLELSIGKVISEDYTHAPPVLVEAYDVAIKNAKIRNIDGVPKLMASVIVEAMKPTAIRSAGMIAAETLLGVGFLPAAVIGIAVARDDARADLGHSFHAVYEESLKLVRELGVVKKTDPKKGQILANVYSSDITIEVQDKGWGRSSVRIKARRLFLPKFEVANGLLYQLTERLK